MDRVRSHGWVRRVLRALLARHRSAEVDASCAVHDEHPLGEADA